jgi:hypothetical protein
MEACVNCGSLLEGHFCAQCGERRAGDRDNHLRAFFGDALQHVTNVDGTLLKSLKLIVTQPGELTRLHMRGRRVGLMRPLQLFLMVNVVYFLFAAAMDNRMFTTTLYAHTHNTWHRGMASRMVSARLGDGTVSVDEYEDRYATYRKEFERVTDVQAKSLIVVMVPALALLVGLLHLRRRHFIVQHVVFALHAYTAFLLLVMTVVVVFGLPRELARQLKWIESGDSQLYDNFFGIAAGLTFAWYLFASLRRAYGDSRLGAALAAPVLALGVVLILFGYRALLFLTTFWATS